MLYVSNRTPGRVFHFGTRASTAYKSIRGAGPGLLLEPTQSCAQYINQLISGADPCIILPVGFSHTSLSINFLYERRRMRAVRHVPFQQQEICSWTSDWEKWRAAWENLVQLHWCYILIKFSNFSWNPAGKKLCVRRGFMRLDYGRWNFWTFLNFLLGLFCSGDACQQHTVQNIMGSRGWKKTKDCWSSRKNYGCSKDWTHDFKVKDQHLSH